MADRLQAASGGPLPRQQAAAPAPSSQGRPDLAGRGNIHQLLQSPACRGVVSLNSNVVHDAFLWNVPAVVLGKNIWPREGRGPFLTALPEDWARLATHLDDPDAIACRRAYAHYLMRHQWTLEDTASADRVRGLLGSVTVPAARQAEVRPIRSARSQPRRAARTAPARSGIRVNVTALNKGWFFEDLKGHFRNIRREGIEIVTSERPRRDADARGFSSAPTKRKRHRQLRTCLASPYGELLI